MEELDGPVDGAVDVRLSRTVENRLRLIFVEQAVDRLTFADVTLDKDVIGIVGDGFERVEASKNPLCPERNDYGVVP